MTKKQNEKMFKIIAIIGVVIFLWAICEDCNKPKIEAQTPKAETITEIIAEPIIEIDLFDKYFGSEAPLMRAICQAENGTQEPSRVSKPNKNGSVDIGLCQINSIHADKVGGNLELLKDAETNIRVAKEIRDSWESWNAWTCYKNGSYKQFIK